MKYLDMDSYLMGRCSIEDLPDAYCFNANVLIPKVNGLLEEFGYFRKITSGYRRPEDNAAVKGSKGSAHLTCEAVDLEDKDGKLKAYCTEGVLIKHGLYRESDEHTAAWCHLTTRSPRSGKRIFNP